MNKKEAIAYAQVTLESMQRLNYKHKLSLENFSIEMKQAFKLYPRWLIVSIAKSKVLAEKELKTLQSGCDINGS